MNVAVKNKATKFFNSGTDDETKNNSVDYQGKIDKMYGANKTFNPFLDKNGNVFNKYINYQKVLDNPNVSAKAKDFISQATGLSPTVTPASTNVSTGYSDFQFNANADENSLASLDVTTELPKLSTNQISDIISKHFGKSTVIKPSDASGIFNAQQKTGMSALAILGIGALESGYGTSNIAKQKNNIWGWNATNDNPGGNATTFSQMSDGAMQFADAFMKTYYNGYGAKSIFSAGTGNNPSGKGYAYFDNGTINSGWSDSVGSIMKMFYQTAKSSYPPSSTVTPSKTVGKKVANTSTYNNGAVKGQCVWYALGRAKERTGKDISIAGNANEMWHNAKSEAKLAPSADNIKPNTLASYQYGTSSNGKKYGHVIYIEDVVGDVVYYTEGGAYYHNNGTDGVLKATTKQNLMQGMTNTGANFGSGLIGFIDLNKY